MHKFSLATKSNFGNPIPLLTFVALNAIATEKAIADSPSDYQISQQRIQEIASFRRAGFSDDQIISFFKQEKLPKAGDFVVAGAALPQISNDDAYQAFMKNGSIRILKPEEKDAAAKHFANDITEWEALSDSDYSAYSSYQGTTAGKAIVGLLAQSEFTSADILDITDSLSGWRNSDEKNAANLVDLLLAKKNIANAEPASPEYRQAVVLADTLQGMEYVRSTNPNFNVETSLNPATPDQKKAHDLLAQIYTEGRILEKDSDNSFFNANPKVWQDPYDPATVGEDYLEIKELPPSAARLQEATDFVNALSAQEDISLHAQVKDFSRPVLTKEDLKEAIHSSALSQAAAQQTQGHSYSTNSANKEDSKPFINYANPAASSVAGYAALRTCGVVP